MTQRVNENVDGRQQSRYVEGTPQLLCSNFHVSSRGKIMAITPELIILAKELTRNIYI